MSLLRGSFSVVIPAAGSATRLRPLTTSMSKAMVPINGKPCIDFILDRVLKESNVGKIVIVDGPLDDIRNHVGRRYGDRVTFVKQGELLGPRHAIEVGMNAVPLDEHVVVWLGDAIILDEDVVFGLDFLMTIEAEDQSPWCVWGGLGSRLYVNKPKSTVPGARALVGLYSFSSSVAAKNAFTLTTGYDISDALNAYERMGRLFHDLPAKEWYDIGEPRTYHETRAKLLNRKARAFNTFDYDADLGLLTKRPVNPDSAYVNTIIAERKWYEELTKEQSMFVPRTFPCDHGLSMTFSSGILLSDLLLYDDIPESTWSYIIRRLVNVVEKYFHSERMPLERMASFKADAAIMWIQKSRWRLNEADLDQSVVDTLMEFADQLADAARPVGAIHGDLHLGNVLYDPQTDRLTLLDPRGRFGDTYGKSGDALYDWAKLAHDMYFGYYALVANAAPNPLSRKIFLEVAPKDDINIITKGGLLLIATAIPLHYEDADRQERMRRLVIDNIDGLK